MKYILLLSIVAFTSCSKSDSKSSKCYECEATGFANGQPVNPQTRTICTDKVDTVMFYDSNGNALNHSCKEK